jgi:hypothetical protein
MAAIGANHPPDMTTRQRLLDCGVIPKVSWNIQRSGKPISAEYPTGGAVTAHVVLSQPGTTTAAILLASNGHDSGSAYRGK